LDDAGQHRVCATLHLSSSPAKLDCPMPRLTLLGAAKDVPEAARMFPGKPAFLAT